MDFFAYGLGHRDERPSIRPPVQSRPPKTTKKKAPPSGVTRIASNGPWILFEDCKQFQFWWNEVTNEIVSHSGRMYPPSTGVPQAPFAAHPEAADSKTPKWAPSAMGGYIKGGTVDDEDSGRTKRDEEDEEKKKEKWEEGYEANGRRIWFKRRARIVTDKDPYE